MGVFCFWKAIMIRKVRKCKHWLTNTPALIHQLTVIASRVSIISFPFQVFLSVCIAFLDVYECIIYMQCLETEDGVRSPGTGVTVSCELLCCCVSAPTEARSSA